MSRAKDKRINKIKKHRLWPSLLFLCIINILVFGLVIGIASISFVGIIDNKLSQIYSQSKQISKLFDDFYESKIDTYKEDKQQYIDIFEDIDTISIGNHNKILWSSSDKKPNLDNKYKYYRVSETLDGSEYMYIVTEDMGGIFYTRNEELVIKENMNAVVSFENLINLISAQENVTLEELGIWIEIPVSGYSVYVLNDFQIKLYDLLFLTVVVIVVVLLVFVFSIYYIISLVSIIKSQRRTTKLLYTDVLTGGNNWIYFIKKATKLVKKNGSRTRYAVVSYSMDKYRSFCTCFGVKEGEELIERLYRIIKKNINRNEVISYRENSDFAILIAFNENIELVSRIEKLGKIINEDIKNFRLKFSAGICIIDDNEKDIESLYNNAVIAKSMLHDDIDKKIAFFDIEMNNQQLWERKIEDDMDKALVTKEFKVYLQPKYSTSEEKLAGAEALVRWIHTTEGLIPPGRFIPIFEQNGFILQLDDYMLDAVASQQAKWISEGKKVFPISVNISRAHFTREDLAEHVCEIVDKYDIPHEIIELELTESAFFDDKPVLIETVRKLKQYGFIVSMDDFGAGYSSLNALKELPIDVLKIDADFFKDTGSVERGLLIVSEVVDLGKKLDMKIVAEGIENREQVDFLAEQECDLIQGYYFAKPMPIDEFEENYINV